MRNSLRASDGPKPARTVHRLVLVLGLAGLLAGCGAGGADGGAPLKGGTTPSGGVTLTPAFAVSTMSLPLGQPGRLYPSTTLTAVNAPGAVTWSLVAGTLPTGLTLTADGVLSGTPTAEEFRALTVRATSGALSATRTLGLSVGVFGLVASRGLVGQTAWSGAPVSLCACGASGAVRFEVVSNGSAGSLETSYPMGDATWLPGAATGTTDRLAAVDEGSGARAQIEFAVERDPTATYAPAFGTSDVWYVDPSAKLGTHAYATDLHAVLAATGLRAAASTGRTGTVADDLAELCLRVAMLRQLNLAFGRNADGTAGTGLPISFAFEAPAGFERPQAGSWLSGSGSRYSVIALVWGSRSGVLGTAFTDSTTNALHENNTTAAGAGELGVFANQVVTTFNVAYNNFDLLSRPLCDDDVPALENVLYGRARQDGRTTTLATILGGLGRTLAGIAAHEIGHSLGLPHTNPSVPGSMMNGTSVIAPEAQYAFLATDMAALRARLPGPGRFGGASTSRHAPALPEGGLAVCTQQGACCDLTLAGAERPAHLPAWALRAR